MGIFSRLFGKKQLNTTKTSFPEFTQAENFNFELQKLLSLEYNLAGIQMLNGLGAILINAILLTLEHLKRPSIISSLLVELKKYLCSIIARLINLMKV